MFVQVHCEIGFSVGLKMVAWMKIADIDGCSCPAFATRSRSNMYARHPVYSLPSHHSEYFVSPEEW